MRAVSPTMIHSIINPSFFSGLIDQKYPLVVIAGPTAVGKTACAIAIAEEFDGEIISADARQFYRQLSIGTAKPTAEERARAPHHFVDFLDLTETYTAGQFENDALKCIESIRRGGHLPIMAGGSGMYIRAVTDGLDQLPADPELREEIAFFFQTEGLIGLQNRLKKSDPEHLHRLDAENPVRLIRAIEVAELTGRTHRELLSGNKKERPFRPVIIGLHRERAALYEAINHRVDKMMDAGLLREAEAALPYRQNQALQTVGYKELFAYLDGAYPLERAVELIKRNTRRYAKRQGTWLRGTKGVHWFEYNDIQSVMSFLKSEISKVK